MAKTGKRILAIVILILVVLLVGWLLYTGNRLAKYPDGLDEYKRATFEGKENTIVAFTDDGAWYGTEDKEVIVTYEAITYEVTTSVAGEGGTGTDEDAIHSENFTSFE